MRPSSIVAPNRNITKVGDGAAGDLTIARAASCRCTDQADPAGRAAVILPVQSLIGSMAAAGSE